MFKKSARFYDAIYAWKDYAGESQKVHQWIQQYGQSGGSTLLDVACGSGAHLVFLREHYAVEGLDLDDGLLAVAQEKLPDVRFHMDDMRDFDLGKTYDVVTCLFSAISYVQTLPNLKQTLATFYRHLKPGGLAIVEGFLQPDRFRQNHVSMLTVDEETLKVARMNIGQFDGRIFTINFHYLVGTPDSIDHFTEEHVTALFSDAEYLEAFRAAGFDVQMIESGLMENRSVFIGQRPQS